MTHHMLYQDLLQPQPKAFHEDFSPYYSLQERHLQAAWYEQKYLLPLSTLSGKRIEVVSPGLWNSGKGPDFCKAHLKIDGIEVFGDIEIHLDEEGWRNHGHHEDPFYNRVVLHLAFWGREGDEEIVTENGNAIERVLLEQQMTLPPKHLIEKLDLDLYPYKEFLGSGKCAQELFVDLETEEIRSFFKSAADWRLQKKYESLTTNFISPKYRFAAGIATVLGYRHNGKQFLELFEYLLPHRNMPMEQLLALTLGVCGFFEAAHATRWQSSDYYTTLHALWGGLSSWALHQTNLRLDGIRPLNHPVRRLALLVMMLHDGSIDKMEKPLLQLWNRYKEQGYPLQTRKRLLQEISLQLPSYDDIYWNSHFTFEPLPQKKYLSLLGDESRLQIVTNIFLPFLFEEIKKRNDPEEIEAFDHFFFDIPEVSTGKRKYLNHRFFGESGPEKMRWGAAMEQGAYQLHTDFCTRYESSCVGCPFVDKMKLLLKSNSQL